MRGDEPPTLGIARVVPVREADLTGPEVLRLERGESLAVEPAAVPAGEVGELDHENGGFRIAQGGRAREQNVSETTGGHSVSYHTGDSTATARLPGPQTLLIWVGGGATMRRRLPMDYKATLNLPQTDFPMKANLPQREPEILARWEREHLYERIQEARRGRPLYVLHDGPPYANGRIHIGHALNKVLKDIVVKSKTMEDYQVPFVPGWDCHGLPIEHQVLKELGAKKKTLGKVEIRKLCREYAEKYFKIQREEFQRLGVLGDWHNPYLTMTYDYQAVCLHPDFDYAFVRVGDEVLVIAEKLVDAVARACGLSGYNVLGVRKGRIQLGGFEGLRCRRPASEGTSPILLGEFVTLDEGTGCVHIAPGHGQEDYELALKYNDPHYQPVIQAPLEVLAPVDDQGRFTDEAPEWQGKTVFEANPLIVQKLKATGVLLGEGTLTHTYPHCWRCKKSEVFPPTDQAFVSMAKEDRSKKALEQIDIVRLLPPRGRDRIYGMILNRPDWCLSRQRVWGVPIPGFMCQGCGQVLITPAIVEHVAKLVEQHGTDVWFEREAAELLPPGTTCPKCGGGDFDKERDILDVWFESGVSHAAVLKPLGKAAGQEWLPADLYLEGSDQHRGWFHSTLLAGITTDGRAPYKSVLTHGFVLDGEGNKMSKSAGNVVAPQEVIKQYGAEILRLWVAGQDYQEDVRISQTILTQLGEVYRKVRNTTRFLLSNLADYDPHRDALPDEHLSELDRWALLRLHRLIDCVRHNYQEFDFRQIFHELDYFCAVDMSPIYFDVLKDRLYTFRQDAPARRASQRVLHETLLAMTKLMAPILSFTAEEIWQSIPEQQREAPSVHLTQFPKADPRYKDVELEKRWERLLHIRTVVQAGVEMQRRGKLIGAPPEAKVRISPSSGN